MPIVPDTPPGNLTIGMTGFNERAAEQIAFINDLMTQLNQAAGFVTGADLQTGPTDATADAILTNGAWGLGSIDLPTCTDANALLGAGTGWRKAYGAANMPAGSTDVYALMHVDRSSGAAYQIALNMTDAESFIRYYAGGAWTAWAKQITSANVQTSEVDATDGQLLKFFDYLDQPGTGGPWGLGATHAINTEDANALSRTGFYRTTNTTANIPISGFGSLILNEAWSDTYAAQTFIRTDGGSYPRIFTRTKKAGNWNAWVETYTQSSVLGTVSQVGGLPTGALEEHGTNANGEYWRFACGYQMVTSPLYTMDVTTASGAIFLSSSVAWTYPATFEFVGGAGAICTNDSATWATGTGNNTTSALRAFRGASVSGRNVRGWAVGRWF